MISNLGGSPKDVTCPWCSGTGRRQPNIDAQASWRAQREAETVSGEPAAGKPASEGSSPVDAPAAAEAGGGPAGQAAAGEAPA